MFGKSSDREDIDMDIEVLRKAASVLGILTDNLREMTRRNSGGNLHGIYAV